jgi:hypothetical protein
MSYAKRTIVPITMMRKNILMNRFPFKIASLAPAIPPRPLQIAIGIAIWYKIRPCVAKKTIDPKLVARLISLA